jgi:SAM-dependent methyltransferase
MMINIASCDGQGTVYIGENAVFRVIPRSHVDSVRTMLKIIENSVKGIIETSICDDADVPTEIKAQGGSLVLKHKRIAHISYPHEWCAKMLQDAAILHLDLSEKLRQKSLVLKDAHPWNVLFDRGEPVFVDFTSIVTTEGLFAEDYLHANQKQSYSSSSERLIAVEYEIYKRMFQPYFINPLMFYECGDRSRVRHCIENNTLNASTSIISVRDCMPKGRLGRSMIKKVWRFFSYLRTQKRVFASLSKTGDIERFYSEMRHLIQSFRITLGGSAYSEYYQKKGEQQDLSYSKEWNDKQKSVHDALDSQSISSVLDVACNTGWFALMAEKLGKSVVAFDIDEGCIETLYAQVKRSKLNVLPLVINFTELTRDKYSIHDGQKVLINATERLRSDSVLALGIIHHLVLGLGLSFDEVLNSLVPLSNKQLIIEFVEPDDAMILNEPSFFPAYFKDKSIMARYDMQQLITKIESHGFNVTVKASHPATRKMLVCDRNYL